MIEADFVIKNKLGLHIRPANELVSRLSKFKSDIKIMKGDAVADAKSVLDLLTLTLSYGDVIKVIINGEDEQEAMKVIKDFIEHDFYYTSQNTDSK